MKISWMSLGASPMEGSSSSTSFGSVMSALPTTVICCSPPLTNPAVSFRFSRRRGK